MKEINLKKEKGKGKERKRKYKEQKKENIENPSEKAEKNETEMTMARPLTRPTILRGYH